MSISLVPLATGIESPITFDVWTFAFQAFNVLVVMLVLYLLLFKPLGRVMENRERFVDETLNRANATQVEAERLLGEYQIKLKNAENEAKEIVEKAAREAEQYVQTQRLEAQREAEATLKKAKEDIEAERLRALASIRDEVASLAVLAASRIVGRALTENDHRRLIEELVSEVEQEKLAR